MFSSSSPLSRNGVQRIVLPLKRIAKQAEPSAGYRAKQHQARGLLRV
jgi:hypothetical protein